MSGSAVCVVQARTGSSRLPGKVLQDLGGRPLLSFMLDRLSSLRSGPVVVATSTLDRDEAVAALAVECGVECIRGPETDVLARFTTVLHAHPADDVVRLTADCPLADPDLVEAVLALHRRRGADYTCNVLPRTFPRGLDVEVATASALRKAAREAVDLPEREHVTPFLYRHPERFTLANLRSGHDLGKERWTVDTADDLAALRQIVERIGGRTRAGWREILALTGRRATPRQGELRLRPAEAGDASAVLAWRNDPDAVRFSTSGRPVQPVDHRSWFAARLEDPASRIWIADRDGNGLGTVRIDVEDAVGAVSIAVAEEARRQGIAGRMLDLLQRELAGDFQVVRLTALVREDNAASLRLFARAGFVPVATRGGFSLLSWAKMVTDREDAQR
ncbi:MAG: GNAT family N-acetyltransferase [Acidimicrobiales bacterium]